MAFQQRIANPCRRAGETPPAQLITTGALKFAGLELGNIFLALQPPRSYGAGILPLIEECNWQAVDDLAETYVNWGGYAYTGEEYGVDMRPVFRHVLAGVQVAVKNQDNGEHDIFDSDDHLQYHGGMIAAIRSLSGKQPRSSGYAIRTIRQAS